MRGRLLAMGLLAILPVPCLGAAEGPVRPNFIVIVIDDLGWSDLGCYGSTFHKTPNLDDLARRGVRFSNGYAACPVCSPTRASLLTGRYPSRIPLTDWLPGRPDRPDQKLRRPPFLQHLPLEEETIAETLEKAGYTSASIGKWHLGPPPFSPERQGFAVNIGGTQAGSPPGGYFRFKTPTLTARDDRDYLTDRLTEAAEAFLEENKERPFFLYLPHYAVHIPLQAPEERIERFHRQAKPGAAQNNPIYAAMLQIVDDGVGRLVRKVERLGIADRTWIIFTSDNGGLSVREGPNTPATSNAPLRAGKGYLYEGGIRVPWIISGPGIARTGRVCDVPICSIDLFPTILEIAGVPLHRDVTVDGTSLVGLLRGTATLPSRSLFWHYPHYSNEGGKPGGAIRAGKYKLIEFFEDGRLELYDLERDLSERNDLAPLEPAIASRLHRELESWRRAVHAQLPTPNPDYAARPGR